MSSVIELARPHAPVQFDEDEDEELAAQIATPKRRWIKCAVSLAMSAVLLVVGIAIRILYPQPVRSSAAVRECSADGGPYLLHSQFCTTGCCGFRV